MLSVKEKGILLNIIDHCKRIEDVVANASRETLDVNRDIKEIVCFNIFQIGELAKKLENTFLQKYNQMPWSSIKGMRDVVAHSYGTINLDLVWSTATQNIGPLNDYCEQIIKENEQ